MKIINIHRKDDQIAPLATKYDSKSDLMWFNEKES